MQSYCAPAAYAISAGHADRRGRGDRRVAAVLPPAYAPLHWTTAVRGGATAAPAASGQRVPPTARLSALRADAERRPPPAYPPDLRSDVALLPPVRYPPPAAARDNPPGSPTRAAGSERARGPQPAVAPAGHRLASRAAEAFAAAALALALALIPAGPAAARAAGQLAISHVILKMADGAGLPG